MLRQLNFLLLKLTITPTQMCQHAKSIKRGLCRPGSQTWMHHHITPQGTSVCTAPISFPLSPLTRGKEDSDSGSTGGGCKSLVSLLSLVVVHEPEPQILAIGTIWGD